MGDPLRGHLAEATRAPRCETLQELVALLAVTPSSFLRQMPGRETFSWPERSPQWVIKRFEGDEKSDSRFDRRQGMAGRSPGQREFENLVALRLRGMGVPEPLGWLQSGDHSLLLMAFVPHASNLRDRLLQCPEAWRTWRSPLLGMTLALHAPAPDSEPGFHRDFYLQHFLISGEPERLCLIDVGRVRLVGQVKQRWFEKDLAALDHSGPAFLGDLKRLAWLGRYLDGILGPVPRPMARKRLFSWAKTIRKRQIRMQKHHPRHGEGPA
ncbi:MAG: hypothetical protein GY930_10065 [bacterium]|nr:hypothetical protein [bacterium]